MVKSQRKIGAILSYIIVICNLIITLVYTPVMLRILGQAEYGVYTLVASFIGYLSLLSLGLNGSYLRFYSRFKAKKQRTEIHRLNGLFLTVFLILGLIAAAAGIVMTFYSNEILGSKLTYEELKTAKVLMSILVFNIFLTFPTTVFDSIISSHEAFFFQRIITLFSVVANPLIALPLLLLGYKAVGLVVVTTLLSVIRLSVDIIYCKKMLHTKFIFKNLNFSLLKEISVFALFIFLNMIIDQLNWNIDKFILGRVSGSIAIAIYGVGATFNTLDINFSTSVSSVFAPKVNMMVANQDGDEEITKLFIKTGRVQFIIMALIDSGLVFFGKYFIEVWAGKGYEQAYYVALLLILPAIVPLIQNIGIEIQRAKNKHKFRSIIYAIMAVINVAISIPLAKAYGPIGSALGTGASLIVANGLIMNWYYQKHLGINILKFWRSILTFMPALIAPVISGILILKFVEYKNFAEFGLWVVIYTLIYCISMWLLGMNTYEKRLITDLLRKRKITEQE